MINFRFHLVSLIAVFLALGVGILVGSTVIDQKIVDRLDTEIGNVRNEISTRKAESKVLNEQNSQLRQFIADSEPYVYDGTRLEGLSIAVVAEHGVDTGVVKKTEKALQAAGADVPAVLWLDEPWLLDTDARVQALQSALGLQGSASATRDAALRALAQRLSAGPASTPPRSSTSTSTRKATSTSSPASVPPVDALTALEKAGFLRVTDGDASAFDTFPAEAANVLVITGDDSNFLGSDLTPAFVRALIREKLPTLAAAIYDAGGDPAQAPDRGAALAPVLDDHALSRVVSTVDDLDLVQGRIATVLALSGGGTGGIVGHYGYGAGASAPVPPHRS